MSHRFPFCEGSKTVDKAETDKTIEPEDTDLVETALFLAVGWESRRTFGTLDASEAIFKLIYWLHQEKIVIQVRRKTVTRAAIIVTRSHHWQQLWNDQPRRS